MTEKNERRRAQRDDQSADVAKLRRMGGGFMEGSPERETIIARIWSRMTRS